MPLMVKASTQGRTPLGLYVFQLNYVEETVGKDFKTGAPIDQYKWVWKIERSLEAEPSEEQEAALGGEYWEWSGQVATPRSKLRARLEALLGRAMGDDEAVDIESLYGRRVRATVTEDTKPEGGKYVTLITAPYQRRAAKPAQPEPEPDPEPDPEDPGDELPF